MNPKIKTVLDDHKESIIHAIEHNLKHEQAFFVPEKTISGIVRKLIEPKGIEIKELCCSPSGVKTALDVSARGGSFTVTLHLLIRLLAWDGKTMKAEICVTEDIAGNDFKSRLMSGMLSGITFFSGKTRVEELITKVNIKGLTFSNSVIYFEQDNLPIPEFLQIGGAEHKHDGIMLHL
ncbi:MAG: hypothetical protein WCI51_01710 [Lentisphaerota bacterium]